jgi:hypothetical protein
MGITLVLSRTPGTQTLQALQVPRARPSRQRLAPASGDPPHRIAIGRMHGMARIA